MKPTKCPGREKKNEGRKAKKEGRREREKYLEVLLFAHARTSQANILHPDQKTGKYTTCKRLCGKF